MGLALELELELPMAVPPTLAGTTAFVLLWVSAPAGFPSAIWSTRHGD